MKRPLIITIGIVIILLVLGLWVYLLVFGTPKESSEVFTNLGILAKNETQVRVVDPLQTQGGKQEGVQLALGGLELQQLTTRAVAGFAFASSSSSIVRYVEKGTGHVYEIDLTSGQETQISLLTLPQTVRAFFSPDAESIAFVSYDTYTTNVVVGTLTKNQEQMDIAELPQNAQNISFKNDSTLYYSLTTDGVTKGYSYNINTLTSTELLSIELADIDLTWGNGLTSIYAQTKPSQYAEGYLYTVSKNILLPVGQSHTGLTSVLSNTNVINSYIEDGIYMSSRLFNATNSMQSIVMLDEKCVFNPLAETSIWCASPKETLSASYLENWYKGTITSKDALWLSDLSEQSSTLIADLSILSGRTIDISDIHIDNKGTILLFTNKIDQTLWIYQIKQEQRI